MVDLAPNPTRTCRIGGLEIAFDHRVLEPRLWTELQGQWAAELARTTSHPVLEVFCGVGHIGLLAAQQSDCHLVQIDQNPVACAFARDNARRNGLSTRVSVRCGPVRHALAPGSDRFDVIVADPPYLPSDEVGRYPLDPVTAIDGGIDGLGVIRDCLPRLRQVLSPGGALLLQVCGPAQLDALLEEYEGSLWAEESRSVDDHRTVALLRFADLPWHSTGPTNRPGASGVTRTP